MNISEFEKLPVMGILRGITPERLEPLVEVVSKTGLKALEITMNTPNAGDLLKKTKQIVKDSMNIGAGTVLSLDEVEAALDSGAEYIVSPITDVKVISLCAEKNIPVFPGALTPQEVCEARDAGACMVKVFPASLFGPGYFKELRGPFNDIKLMAVGGVKLDNIGEYISCGANAVAFGSSVFKKEWLEEENYRAIGDLISQYIVKVKEAVSH